MIICDKCGKPAVYNLYVNKGSDNYHRFDLCELHYTELDKWMTEKPSTEQQGAVKTANSSKTTRGRK